MENNNIICTHLPFSGSKGILHTPVIHENLGDPGTDLDCRVWVPDGDGPFPVLVLIHGGGFGNGVPAQWDSWGREMTKHGCVTFSTRYRRLRETEGGSLPTFVQDNMACIAWLAAYRTEYKADMDNVAIIGSSAGAGIVLWMTLFGSDPAYAPDFSPHKDEKFTIKACVSYYPSWKKHGGVEAVTKALREYPDKAACPICLIHGTGDTTIPKAESDELHQMLVDAGVEHTYHEYDGFGHGYAYMFPGRENLLTLCDALPFLQGKIPTGRLRFSSEVPESPEPGFHLVRDPEYGNRVIVR